MVFRLQNLSFTLVISLFVISRINLAEAWIWPLSYDEAAKSTDVDNAEEMDGATKSNGNSDVDDEVLEEEDAEYERNLRCSQHFNRNLFRILKSIMPANSTDRMSRQDDTDVDPDDLVQSALNLEASQIILPVLRILGSAAAANATAIDENYNNLPLVLKYDITNFIKFAVDLLTTT